MLTSEGFGFGQAPNPYDGDVEYVVLRGMVINGPKRPGDTVFMNPRAQATIELLAQGRIKPVPVVEVEAQVIESPVNRMVDVKRGRKSK